jgi:hypothetical protein
MQEYAAVFSDAHDPGVDVWRMSDGKRIVHHLRAKECVFSPERSMVATIDNGLEPEIRVWSLHNVVGNSAEVIAETTGTGLRVSFAPLDRKFAILKAGPEPCVEFWDKDGDAVAAVQEGAGEVIWNCTGDYAATMSGTGSNIACWDTGVSFHKTWAYPDSDSALFAPVGTCLVTLASGSISFWDTMLPPESGGHMGAMHGNRLLFSPDGLVAVGISGGRSPKAQVCRPFVNGVPEVLTASGAVDAFFSSDGALLTTIDGGPERAARVWRVADGEKLAHKEGATRVEFS